MGRHARASRERGGVGWRPSPRSRKRKSRRGRKSRKKSRFQGSQCRGEIRRCEQVNRSLSRGGRWGRTCRGGVGGRRSRNGDWSRGLQGGPPPRGSLRGSECRHPSRGRQKESRRKKGRRGDYHLCCARESRRGGARPLTLDRSPRFRRFGGVVQEKGGKRDRNGVTHSRAAVGGRVSRTRHLVTRSVRSGSWRRGHGGDNPRRQPGSCRAYGRRGNNMYNFSRRVTWGTRIFKGNGCNVMGVHAQLTLEEDPGSCVLLPPLPDGIARCNVCRITCRGRTPKSFGNTWLVVQRGHVFDLVGGWLNQQRGPPHVREGIGGQLCSYPEDS